MTESRKIEKEINSEIVTGWEKTCPCCKKTYFTTARRQKYCSEKCCKKAQKKKKEYKERYSHIKEVERIRVRAHKLATDMLDQLNALGIREKKCEVCGCIENLHCHHKDLNWMNNTPSNLMWVCSKHHTQEHSKLEKSLHEQGILVEEFYEESMKPIFKIINK